MSRHKYTRDNLAEVLRGHGITPTHQRIEIAHSIFSRGEHVSADRILALVNDRASETSKATVYNTLNLAVFVLGTVASIDFTQTNGRITGAFKSQSGFAPTVTDQQIATNLLANGYSFYGRYATANDAFNFLYNSQMSGKWKWLDTFVNQV